MKKKKINFKGLFLIFSLIVFVGGGWYVCKNKTDLASAVAQPDYDLEGWAWSDNIGWISFNCLNDSSCGVSDYKVNLNWTTGDLTGYAWSEGIGWIDFDPAGPYPEAPNNSAEMNLGSYQVSGWARALSYGDGWDGWIKMRDGGAYGVDMDARGYFSDWAWSGDMVLGWISFNCLNDGSCGTSDYKVKLVSTPPIISNADVTPDGPISDTYCDTNPVYTFTWDFSDVDTDVFGDVQESFDIQIDNNADFSSPELSLNIVTSDQSYTRLVSDIGYDGAPHYWRIRAYDDRGGLSGWATSASGFFTTPTNQYPDAAYSFSPIAPSKGENVQFYDESVAYGAGLPMVSWNWTFKEPDDTIIGTSILQTPAPFAFPDTGDMKVEFKVTDTSGYFCTVTDESMFVNVQLPGWQEVPPAD